ncbi:aminopeptidase N-like isoform X2 [Denticeps clupeoides]|uniref:aminopeptidase N-like isoform X2 n=1 Tax=Denticeps clupeoides TaxID=299321 RepID=UPI0010A4C79F|nr:aminopeptidase N-like isoform X2 [Denticeps clupeoides]
MAKGFYIHKNVAITVVLLGGTAVATIIALSVILSHERSKNQVKPTMNDTTPSTLMPSTPTPSNEPWDRYRLPDSLLPEYYNVTLWPRLHVDEHGMYIFTGNSTVVFRCVKETDLVLIHSNKLNFTTYSGHHAILSAVDGPSPPAIKTTWLQVRTQYLVVQLNGNLVPGKSYQLFTEFRGELADDLKGFYRSEYYQGSELKIIAATHMQPTDARRVFPCFDEPSMKAVFHVSLIHEPGTVAISNGMEIDTVNVTMNGFGVFQTTFQPTKRMSTYLLAFVACDCSHMRTDERNKVTIRVWARREFITEGSADYAFKVTGPLLELFETFYNWSYPLMKYDQIALPPSSAGPMENWGLVTYSEAAILYHPERSSNKDKERAATILAHELAHMWFGNLVTIKWWSDLWLNEGFATYMSCLGTSKVEPSWNLEDLMVLDAVLDVFVDDSLPSSHPLSTPEEEISSPEEINALFDSITYSKGGLVLRMLSDFLPDSVFTRGLAAYLKQFAYSNAGYSDLWKHLQGALDQTKGANLPAAVHDIMNRWILQMGYPVVTIDSRTGDISQKHFLLDPESVPHRTSPFNYEWIVPIKWMKNGVPQSQHWLMNKTAQHEAMRTEGAEWLLANINMSGYYRVNYDLGNWERLLIQLKTNHQIIPVINRAQILNDAFNLARAKMINVTLALRSTQYLSKETKYLPWEMAIDNLDHFFLMFDRSDVFAPMQTYLRKQVEPLFRYFKTITSNWTQLPSGHTDQYNQVNAISLACRVEVSECQRLVLGWYKQWMRLPDSNPIPPNLRWTVFCHAIEAGGEEEWLFGWDMLQNFSSQEMVHALSCTKEPRLLERYLKYSLDPKHWRLDASTTIGYVATNVAGQALAWDFLRSNWRHMVNLYGKEAESLSEVIRKVTKRFSTEQELKQLQQFKDDPSVTESESAAAALQRAAKRTTANIQWVADNADDVLKWFSSA